MRWSHWPISRCNPGTAGDLGRYRASARSMSLPYLEQLFVKLRRADLVTSVRGPGGGYRLARPASEIRVVDILAAVDETVDAMHKGAGASGGAIGQPRAIADQPVVGRAERACLCVLAPDPPVGCGCRTNWRRVRRCRTCLRWWTSMTRCAQRTLLRPAGPAGYFGQRRGDDRVYLDHNATTPLRAEARAAMIAAMDVVGNPSSVHAEGRAAKALVETARAQVAAALGAEGADVVFTSARPRRRHWPGAGRGLARRCDRT